MKVTVFGIGYVGLVYSAVLAKVGHEVVCIDIDHKKIKNLKNGIIPIYEPNLNSLVFENYKSGRLKFSCSIEYGINHSIIQFITVETPSNYDGSTNLKYIINLVNDIAKNMNSYKIIINKSTVPVGTLKKLKILIKKILYLHNKQHIKFNLISNPEFLKEGSAVKDCMQPTRIVIGMDNSKDIEMLYELYKPFKIDKNRFIFMDINSAELTKYASNCMLATKISFINEMANLAEILGADIDNVRKGISADPRIGNHFIYPGCGYGGSCFPKDIKSLIYSSQLHGYTPRILKSVEDVNNKQKIKLVNFIKNYFGNNLSGRIFAIWGLSFKENTNDMRGTCSKIIIEKLYKANAVIQIFDPQAMPEAQLIYKKYTNIKLVSTKEDALRNADGLVICTGWKSFRKPNFTLMKKYLKQPIIFDGRNLYDPKFLKQNGFVYYAIGRGLSVKITQGCKL